MTSNSESFDLAEVVRRALKYLIQGITVAMAAYYIPQGKQLDLTEILMITQNIKVVIYLERFDLFC